VLNYTTSLHHYIVLRFVSWLNLPLTRSTCACNGYVGMPDGRMFCVINQKIGLIKLVSSNIQEEQEAINKERQAMTAETTALAMQNQP